LLFSGRHVKPFKFPASALLVPRFISSSPKEINQKLQYRRDKVFALPQTVLHSSAETIQNNLGSLLPLLPRNTSKISPITWQK